LSRPFVRQLGNQPGVQLNPLVDQTDGVVPDNSDQVLAIVGRFTRGPVDRAFQVNRSNLLQKTGPAEALRLNALNEAKLQVYEALQNGAYAAVISRLVPEAAEKKWAVLRFEEAGTVAFAVSATQPNADYSLALLHHDCHNDGIIVGVHADQTPVNGMPVANEYLTLRVLDADGAKLHEFYGSLSETAVNDFGASMYLPDVVARQTEAVEMVVATGASVPTNSVAYGRANGEDRWATSSGLICFDEGSIVYTPTDLDAAVARLRETELGFGYIISGGTGDTALIGKLAALAIEANVFFKVDLPGRLTPTEAMTLLETYAFDSHYIHAYWAPFEADDPLNGGRATWGTGGLIAGMSCARNARVNAKGFAPKNYPIAGKAHPVGRTGIRQNYRPTQQELSDLAALKINPVIFQTFNGGGRYVPTDSLTTAKTTVSFRKLQSVAEMTATLDNWVTLYARELLQSPMTVFIRKMKSFLDTLLSNAQASGWLVPSRDIDGVPALPGNAAFAYDVKPSEVRPADLALVSYWTSCDGVVRQVIVEQTLTR